MKGRAGIRMGIDSSGLWVRGADGGGDGGWGWGKGKWREAG